MRRWARTRDGSTTRVGDVVLIEGDPSMLGNFEAEVVEVWADDTVTILTEGVRKRIEAKWILSVTKTREAAHGR